MATYTTWAKVTQLYPRASDVESNGTNQTALITAYSDLFHSYIRGIHKDDLTSPVNEAVSQAVALLIVDELRRRTQTDDDERAVEVAYQHFTGLTSQEGAGAHAIIDAIRRGALILDQDDAEHDLHYPEPIANSGNTGTGKVQVYLPHEYKSNREDEFLIEIETTGRVDVSTATFMFYINNSATATGSGVVCSEEWIHLQNELYVRFLDTAQSGNSFVDGDKFTVTAKPTTTSAKAVGPRQFEVYCG